MIALDPTIELAVRLSIGMLFTGSLVHKLRDPAAFADTIQAYLRGAPFNGASAGWAAAAMVVAMEIGLVAISLITGPAALAGGLAAALLSFYAVAMGANIARGNVLLDCGCAWAAERQPVSGALVVRNIVLAVVAGLLLLPGSPRAATPFDIVNAVILTGLLMLTYVVCNQLILNAQHMKAKRI